MGQFHINAEGVNSSCPTTGKMWTKSRQAKSSYAALNSNWLHFGPLGFWNRLLSLQLGAPGAVQIYRAKTQSAAASLRVSFASLRLCARKKLPPLRGAGGDLRVFRAMQAELKLLLYKRKGATVLDRRA